LPASTESKSYMMEPAPLVMADAIAGVVNIIVKDEYSGADPHTCYGIMQRGDGAKYRASLTGGIASKLWNVHLPIDVEESLGHCAFASDRRALLLPIPS